MGTIGRGTGNRPYDVYDKAETVSKAGVETITGQKTFTAPVKVADATLADEALSKGQLLTEMKTVDGAGSGLNADLLDGYNLDQNGIPLLRGYQANGKITNDNTDLNTISVNATYNINGGNTLNAPEATWGFVTTYIHSNFSATNACRTQVFIGMQSASMFVRRGNPDGTWTAWVRKTTVNDLLGVNQTWQDVTASRAFGVTYTNTTGKPIMVSISISNENKKREFTLDSIVFVVGEVSAAYYHTSTCSFIVPNGSTYSYNSTFVTWAELK